MVYVITVSYSMWHEVAIQFYTNPKPYPLSNLLKDCFFLPWLCTPRESCANADELSNE